MIRTTQSGLRRIGRARMAGNPAAICRGTVGSPLKMNDCTVNAQLLYDTPAKQILPVARNAAFIPPSAMKTSPVTISNGATFIAPDVFNEIPQYGPAVSIAPPSSRGPMQRRARVPGRVTSPATPPASRRSDIALRRAMLRPTAPGVVDPSNPDTVLSKYVGLGVDATASIPTTGNAPNVGGGDNAATPTATTTTTAAGTTSLDLSSLSQYFTGPVTIGTVTIDKSLLWVGGVLGAFVLFGGKF